MDVNRDIPQEESNCSACRRPDSAEDMVQCDQCDVWKHYSCAGVDATVAGRAFVCGDCTVYHDKDAISVHSGSSRSSTTSTFSVSLSQMVERQRLERARLEVDLQRRHLDEQQKLIDEVLGGAAEDNQSDAVGDGATNEVSTPKSSKRIATLPPPDAPLMTTTRRSTKSSGPPKATTPVAPVMVSIPLSALDPKTVHKVKSKKVSSVAMLELRNRIEQCEKRADPTPEQLAGVQAQLELCRKLLEGFQTGAARPVRKPETSKLEQVQPVEAASVAKSTGAIPKANRLIPTVPKDDCAQLESLSQAGAVGETFSQEPIWPLREPVSQSGWPSVSDAVAASEMHPNHSEPPGKRQALSKSATIINPSTSNYCPTTNNPKTREQPRYDARPGTLSEIPPTNPREQLRDLFAHSSVTNPYSIPNTSQSNRKPFGEQSRCTSSRAVDSLQPPRQAANAQQNHAIPQPDATRPTQQQLAARQSLAKDLPRFSGDPAEWPIFISNFRYTTEACGFSDGENMLRLQRCLSGPALEMVRSRLVLPEAVPQVIETLRMRFGRPELLINTLLRKVREIPALRPDKLEGLIDFGMAVQALCDHIEAADERAHLSNPSLLQELVGKLPADQRMMWAGYKRGFHHVDLKTFGDYMASVVRDALSVVTYEPEAKRSNTRDRPKNKGFINSHAGDPSGRSTNSSSEPRETSKQFDCQNCNQSGHRVRDCSAFKRLSVDDRWRRVRALGLCQNCLFSHGRRACRLRKICDIEGCQFRHHPLLHSSRGPPKSSEFSAQVAENHTHRRTKSSTLFRIIPVTLHGVNGSINTFAFLDEGSDLTLVENELVSSLGVKGTASPLCLRWTGNTSRVEKDSQQVTVEITGVGQEKRYKLLNARTVSSLGLPSQSFVMEEAVRVHKHLKGIPITSYQNAVPKILIGIDNLRLAMPLKVREGDGSAPVAVKTRLGWCVYGPRGSNPRESYSFHICECTCDTTLHESVKTFFAVEGTGAGPTEPALTKEDQRALTIMRNTTRRVADRFETGLLWRDDHIEFPDSFLMAKRRLDCLERRMERDPELKSNLHRQIREYEEKGYAHRASRVELAKANPRRMWYLPVGAVTNPKKPGKVRIIWDAAAKVDGVSLNSALLKGPDQLSSLPGILFRFRLYWVAVSSDIQEMFHQLRIRPEDKISQLFLWRTDPSNEPTVYVMDVATFGSTCSPASAQFVKNRNAELHSKLYPEAATAIIRDHYVDDYLASFSSVDEAAKVATDVRHVHASGGFKLHNWRSNNSTVLTRLDEEPQETDKPLNLAEGEKAERVLGMLWSPKTDKLSFSTQMSEEVQTLLSSATRPTKRQVLRCVMTLFDPLGLLSPYIIHGKALIQDLWREGTEWDEQVSDEVHSKWQRWIQMIKHIAELRIPRCYFPGATSETYQDSAIHVFVDASEMAYSCAIYLQSHNMGVPQNCLIAAKSKVAPLKPWSIPRLELQACVLGTRWSKYVVEHLGVPVTKVTYWSDSRTALAWIKADPRNYRQFVSFRVGEILEHTSGAQWRWVPSKSNPADEATKWGSGPYFNHESKWFHGPHFLQLPEDEWPRITEPVTATTEEMRASILHHSAIERVINFDRHSSWDRLQRSTAYALRFLNNARRRHPKLTGSLQQSELQAAEEIIYKLTQREAFPDEIAALSNKAPSETGQGLIGKSSIIYKLVPIMDDRGLLRERGRIGAAQNVSYGVRYPLILPRKHHVTELLIYRYHCHCRHGNSETVVNEVRQRYSISRLRQIVKKVSRDCVVCKFRRAKPSIPPMAPLPLARLAHHERAFTYTGLDYFGPLLVKLGRSNVKRWIALFTCLTVRAVHLEVAFTLSTESCISCVRRFVSRRGPPAEFYSDNGTNFQGAERVLRYQINQGLSTAFTSTETKWNFIPPGAPHMGGAWERLVQSVKAGMAEAYSEGKLDDEGLQTLVVEVEHLVNSRPLTYLPLESEEAEALTPNHFLLLDSNGVKRPTEGGDIVVRERPSELERGRILGKSFGLIQSQIEVFWQRWLVEYLPVIRRQSKWFEESRALEPGDLVLVAEPSKRSGWERGRIVQLIAHPDGKIRRAHVQIGQKILVRPVTRLALLDVKGQSEDPKTSGLHPGEIVNEENGDLATLITDVSEGSMTAVNARRQNQ